MCVKSARRERDEPDCTALLSSRESESVSRYPQSPSVHLQEPQTTCETSKRDMDKLRQEPVPDILALSTVYFRDFLQHFERLQNAFKRSHHYKLLSRTTQPAHLITFLAVSVVAVLLSPAGPGHRSAARLSPWTSLIYITSFAAHFGSQFWMTFVSGLSLFFSLPRHHFAEVQKVLFPLYFAINSALSLLTLGAFLSLETTSWDIRVSLQVADLVFCFMLELLVRLYLTPTLIVLITKKTEMEKTVAGIGQEIGRHELGPLASNPHYLRVYSAFRRNHGLIAVANILTMACTTFHAHYLASKICL